MRIVLSFFIIVLITYSLPSIAQDTQQGDCVTRQEIISPPVPKMPKVGLTNAELDAINETTLKKIQATNVFITTLREYWKKEFRRMHIIAMRFQC